MKHSQFRAFALFLFFTMGLTTTVVADAKDKKHHTHQVVKKSKSHKTKHIIAQKGTTLVGLASFYGYESGPRTASGEPFNPKAMTAAHKTLPFGTMVKVTNIATHQSVIVKINDRGPFVRGRFLDLSKYAAKAIGLKGVGKVSLIVV